MFDVAGELEQDAGPQPLDYRGGGVTRLADVATATAAGIGPVVLAAGSMIHAKANGILTQQKGQTPNNQQVRCQPEPGSS